MGRTLKILVQTTTPRQVDNWSIESLTLMRKELASVGEAGFRFDVVARDRAADSTAPDPVLSTLHEFDFDEFWLFARRCWRPSTAQPRAPLATVRPDPRH